MKSRVINLLAILCVMLDLGFSLATLKAQNASPAAVQSESARFPGSKLKAEDIIAKCDAIVVGTMTSAGVQDQTSAMPLDGPLYHGVKVKVSQILRGSVGDQIWVTLLVSNIERETTPVIGDSYIFLLRRDDEKRWTSYTALKLLPATGDNITKVKALIAAAPAGK